MKWWERWLWGGFIQNFIEWGGVPYMDNDIERTKTIIRKAIKKDCHECFDNISFYCESMCQHNSRLIVDRIEKGFKAMANSMEEIKDIIGDGMNGKS